MLNSVRNKSEALKEGIEMLDGYIVSLAAAENINEIMAYEGLSAKVYFRNHFNNVLWNGRQPRLKRDYVNSALDVGYTIYINSYYCAFMKGATADKIPLYRVREQQWY